MKHTQTTMGRLPNDISIAENKRRFQEVSTHPSIWYRPRVWYLGCYAVAITGIVSYQDIQTAMGILLAHNRSRRSYSWAVRPADFFGGLTHVTIDITRHIGYWRMDIQMDDEYYLPSIHWILKSLDAAFARAIPSWPDRLVRLHRSYRSEYFVFGRTRLVELSDRLYRYILFRYARMRVRRRARTHATFQIREASYDVREAVLLLHRLNAASLEGMPSGSRDDVIIT